MSTQRWIETNEGACGERGVLEIPRIHMSRRRTVCLYGCVHVNDLPQEKNRLPFTQRALLSTHLSAVTLLLRSFPLLESGGPDGVRRGRPATDRHDAKNAVDARRAAGCDGRQEISAGLDSCGGARDFLVANFVAGLGWRVIRFYI